METILPIPALEGDDPEFIEVLKGVVSGLIELHAPERLFLIRIKNWFDIRWLNFSGKGVVHFPASFFCNENETALDVFHQKQTVFPPFTPKRVLVEFHFEKSGDFYEETTSSRPIYADVLTYSSDYLHRRIADFAPSGVFLWYASNTAVTGRGSIMVFVSENRTVTTWFASLYLKGGQWEVYRTKDLRREHFDLLFPCPAA